MNQHLLQLIDGCRLGPRTSEAENALVAYLRKRSREEILEAVKELMVRRSPCAIPVASRTIHKPDLAREFFLFALPTSSRFLKFLLQFGLQKMGPRRTVKVLVSALSGNAKLIDLSLYWLPILMEEKDRKLLDVLKELASQTNSAPEFSGTDVTSKGAADKGH